MANKFLEITLKALQRNGSSATYSVITSVYDPSTLKNTTTKADHTVTMYKRHIRASQFNFPNLIGKDSAIFYVANSGISFKPKVNDQIKFDNDTYVVQSWESFSAHGQVVLYMIVGIKS